MNAKCARRALGMQLAQSFVMARAPSLIVAAAVALAAPLAHTSGALAQAGDPQRSAAAQALYDQGVAAMDAKDYATACPKLEEVVRLIPEGIGAQLSLAQCYEEAGRLASAWTTYTLAEAAAMKAGQKARTQKAHQSAAALKPKLAALTIDVPEATRGLPGLDIQRDGFPVGRAQWGAPIPADRGSHVIVVNAAGKKRWEKTIDVTSDGAAVSVVIEGLEDVEPAPAAVKAPASAPRKPKEAKVPAASPTRAPAPTSLGAQRIAGIAVGGLGLAGLGVGAFFGARAIAKKDASDADDHCNSADRCDDVGLALRAEGLTAARISTALVIAGGVAVAGGVTLFVTAPRGSATGEVKASIGPQGLWLSGTW